MANVFNLNQKTYVSFPNDVYIDACIISFQNADIKPGILATSDKPVPNCRFLFGGYITDDNGQMVLGDDGNPLLIRKWTRWMRISANEKAALMRTFDTGSTGFSNLFEVLRDYEKPDGKLWKTPFKIMLEQSNMTYQNIIRIKPGTNTALTEQAFYDDKYVPYKVIKVYGVLTPLNEAACKLKSGIKIYTPDMMIEPDAIAQ